MVMFSPDGGDKNVHVVLSISVSDGGLAVVRDDGGVLPVGGSFAVSRNVVN